MNPDQTRETVNEVTFEDYRAPRAHLHSLVQPGFESAEELIHSSRMRSSSMPATLASLQRPAREQLIRDAARYTSSYREVQRTDLSIDSIVMAGHQPSLFHPGVWFKNFALDRLASQTNSTAVNLVVDSDVAPPSSIRVPRRLPGGDEIRTQTVSYDQSAAGVPYEQSLVQDRDLFDSFDRSVEDALSGLVQDPLVRPLWNYAREAVQRCGYAGCALAQARHRLEQDLGLNSIEIPQSVVCRSEAFAAFAVELLKELPRFHRCYNAATDFYRAAHGIRSKSHPVPNLRTEGEWLEAPFWLYGNQSPKRRSVWVRLSSAGTMLEISDRDRRHRRVDVTNQDSAAEAFAALSSPEFKLRSRALITTMYARLVLSDLFVHGIGGGKYDQLGDLICNEFWGVAPPEFMVMSATILLPGHETHQIAPINDRISTLERSLRDLQYRPERFAESAAIPAELIATKKELLNAIPPKGHRYDWHHTLDEVNQKMEGSLGSIREDLLRERETLRQTKRNALVWNNREHSFCLFPVDYLCDAYGKML